LGAICLNITNKACAPHLNRFSSLERRTDEQHAVARALVDDGCFPSVSAVFQHGIEAMEHGIRRVLDMRKAADGLTAFR
jgi:hypothetical protein